MLFIFYLIIFNVRSVVSLSIDDLFPFGISNGDEKILLNGTSGGPIDLPYSYPYFDDYYRQLWITTNGIISFTPPSYHFSYPQSIESVMNSSFIAGYWYTNFGYSFNVTGNEIFYGIYTIANATSSNSVNKIMSKTNEYVRRLFPRERPFEAKLVMISTWYYMSVIDDKDNQLNNTFQIVLSTDEDRSFVYFLYVDLQWSDRWNNSYGQSGFRSVNGNISYSHPYSGKSDIVKLTNESNVNIGGLFAYRIDGNEINGGGCDANVSMISFRPRIGSQLGSTSLLISGPCFTKQMKIQCRFNSSNSIVVNGSVLDEYRSICVTPFSSIDGPISVSISIDNGQTFQSAGLFTYSPIQFGSDQVIIEMENNENLLVGGQSVTLKWNFLESILKSLPNDTKLDIELRQINVNNKSELEFVNQSVRLASNLPLMSSSYRVELPSSISSMIGSSFIRIIARTSSEFYGGLNTGLLIVKISSSLSSKLCEEWTKDQIDPSRWNVDDLLECPMTLFQARSSARCCYRLDEECYQGNSKPNNCWLHRSRFEQDESSAVECYSSITINRHGSATECCYDNTSMLITRGRGAGHDQRFGKYSSPIKHFFQDLLPYLHCCFLSNNNNLCRQYLFNRPSRKGSNTMGQTGRMWGDPHFGTLDGTSFTFNGYGEFIYLAITDSNSFFQNQTLKYLSQIRTIPIEFNGNTATVVKGFAARSNDAKAERVSVTISHRQQLIIHRGNQFIEFDENNNRFSFPEMTITRMNKKEYILSWTIGVTIEINLIEMTSPWKQLVLDIVASVSAQFRGKTYGLLGTYDDNSDNDLRSQNGTILIKNASLEQIHKDFGVTWSIDPLSSLFYYEKDQSAKFFHEQNIAFIPTFRDVLSMNNTSHRLTCQIDEISLPSTWNTAQRSCYYDLSVTNDVHFAQSSLKSGNDFLSRKIDSRSSPTFSSSIPLRMDLKVGDFISLNISFSNEYSSRNVVLSVLHLPLNSSFNTSTHVFTWIALSGEHYFSIKAHDMINNLISRHDTQFYVNDVYKGNNTHGSSNGNQLYANIYHLHLLFISFFILVR